MQPELTNRIDLSSSSSPNHAMGMDSQRIIGGEYASVSISDGQVNKSKERIFVICDVCFWATTYLDKSRLSVLDSRCSRCQEIGLSSFPVLANESFTYTYSEKRGLELRFLNRSGWYVESTTFFTQVDTITNLGIFIGKIDNRQIRPGIKLIAWPFLPVETGNRNQKR